MAADKFKNGGVEEGVLGSKFCPRLITTDIPTRDNQVFRLEQIKTNDEAYPGAGEITLSLSIRALLGDKTKKEKAK